MKRLFLTLFILLWRGSAWAAIYYADPAGSGTTCSQASPCTMQYALVTKVANSDTVILNTGTHTQSAAITLTKTGLIISGLSGAVWDCTSATSPHLTTAGNTTIQGIKFSGGSAANDIVITTTGNTTIQNNTFENVDRAFDGGGAYTVVVDKNVFNGSNPRTANVILPRNGGTYTITRNIFKGSTTYPTIGRIYVGGNLDFYNNTCDNFYDIVFQVTTVNTINIKNNLFLSSLSGVVSSNYFLTASAAATINVTNNAGPVRWDNIASTYNLGTATLNQSGNVYTNPKIQSPFRFGYLFVTYDDGTGCTSAINIANSYANPNGQYVTCALPYAQTGVVNQANLQSYINNGNDVFSHANSHTQLITTNLVTITGPTVNSKINIVTTTNDPDSANWTGTMLVCEGTCGGGNTKDTINFNTSQGGTIKSNVVSLVSYLNTKNYGQGAWTVTGNTDDLAPLTTLANVTNTAVTTATSFVRNDTAWYKSEITDAVPHLQTWLRSGATGRSASYSVRGFAAPQNDLTATIRSTIIATGVIGLREDDAVSQVDSLHVNSLSAWKPFGWVPMSDAPLRTGGGGYQGTTNVSFASATKQITITGTTATGFAIGDAIKVKFTTSNNNALTISNLTTGSGNTVITVNEVLTDESNKSALIICKAKFQRNAVMLANHVESSGQFIEIYTHTAADDGGIGLSYEEWSWYYEAIRDFKYASSKTGFNSFLENIWNLGNAPNGNAYSVSAGSKGTPDTTLTFTTTFTDMSDYRLRNGSPCKNAGVSVGLTTDFLGKPIRGLPDIGAYELQPINQGGPFTFNLLW